MIEVIPAIDIIDGRCVRLSQGDYASKRVYGDPLDMAKAFADQGASRIHLVDLDGARAGAPRNLAMLEAIASAVRCELEWGGGIAGDDALQSVFDAGATHAIIGSIAALQPERFEEWLSRFGARLILGADVRDGLVAVKGWTSLSQLGVEDLVQRFLPLGLKECIVTDISRDGMLGGPASALYQRLQEAFPALSFTVSGGISSMDDIRALDAMGLKKVIVGKAIYEERITLKDIALWSQNA